MQVKNLDPEIFADTRARTASEAFAAMAKYLKALPEDAWGSPTGCAEWDMHALAGHAVGEAVWFANLVRGATEGEAPLSMDLYEEMKTWSGSRIADRISDAAKEIHSAVAAATAEQLQLPLDMGWTKLPLWRATYVSAFEATLHNWDARAVREPEATIPTEWAVQVASGLVEMVPQLVHKRGVATASGTCLLDVADGVGSVNVTVRDGSLVVEAGVIGRPDAVVRLNVEQYVRLLTGRLDLDSIANRDKVGIEGDIARAGDLNRIFGGVANEM